MKKLEILKRHDIVGDYAELGRGYWGSSIIKIAVMLVKCA